MSTQGSDNRRQPRRQYKHWVELIVVDEQTKSATQRVQSPAVDLSAQGVGLLVAEPFEVGSPVIARLRGPNQERGTDCFGYVRASIQQGNWYRCGIEFAKPPAWAGDLTFDGVQNNAA